MTMFYLPVNFNVEHGPKPAVKALHTALVQLRGINVEAPSKEAAEHYATLLVKALEEASDA